MRNVSPDSLASSAPRLLGSLSPLPSCSPPGSTVSPAASSTPTRDTTPFGAQAGTRVNKESANWLGRQRVGSAGERSAPHEGHVVAPSDRQWSMKFARKLIPDRLLFCSQLMAYNINYTFLRGFFLAYK